MSWFRVDDALADHPKVLELADTRHYKAAMGLWALAGCWCSKHLTDGAVPRGVVKRLGFTAAEAKALVTCGLWTDTDAGYQFHDWDQCNPLRADVEAKREATAERVKRHRNKPGNALHDEPRNAVTNDAPYPAPPSPSQPDHQPTVDSARDLRTDFSRRFEAQRGGLTWASGRFDGQTKDLAAWLRANPTADQGVMLDNFFGDAWAQSAGFPFGALAKDPAKYAMPPESEDPEAKRRKVLAQREASMEDIRAQMRGDK